VDKFESMRAFVQVVDARGFAAAARQLGLSRSQVNKLVAKLEDHLQTQLLHRTTRRVSPTPAGLAFYERCRSILTEVTEAEEAVRAEAAPKGLLRVNAPLSFGVERLSPVFAEFVGQYPEVRLELHLSDRFIDTIAEGFDVTLRIAATAAASGCVVRELARMPLVLCAAPRYLAERGRPDAPSDLAQHSCLHYGHLPERSQWTLRDGEGNARAIAVSGSLCSNNGDVLRQAAVRGVGVAMLPVFLVKDAIAAGELVPVMAEWRPPVLTLSVLYPVSRHLSPKVQRLLDFLQAHFESPG